MVVGQVDTDQAIQLLSWDNDVLDMTQVVWLEGNRPTSIRVHTFDRAYVTIVLNYPDHRVKKPRQFRGTESTDLNGDVIVKVDTSDLKTRPTSLTVVVKNDRQPRHSGTYILPCRIRA